MKILFSDKAKTGTWSATNEDTFRPAQNLSDLFLTKRFQTTSGNNSSVVTWDAGLTAAGSLATVTISDLWILYNNINDIEIKFYDTSDVLIPYDSIEYRITESGATRITAGGDTRVITASYYSSGEFYNVFAMHLPDSVSGVHTVELTVSTDDVLIGGVSPLYIGGCGFGVALDMPDPLSNMDQDTIDNSVVVSSKNGQYGQNRVYPLRSRPYTFPECTLSIKNEIMSNYYTVGKGFPLYVDLFEGNSEFDFAGYFVFADAPKPVKSGRRYKIAIRLNEAR